MRLRFRSVYPISCSEPVTFQPECEYDLESRMNRSFSIRPDKPIEVEGLIVVCGGNGAEQPLGSPVKDSMAGKIGPADEALSCVIYAPASMVTVGEMTGMAESLAETSKNGPEPSGFRSAPPEEWDFAFQISCSVAYPDSIRVSLYLAMDAIRKFRRISMGQILLLPTTRTFDVGLSLVLSDHWCLLYVPPMWSLRNLDVIMILMLTPGQMMIYEGRKKSSNTERDPNGTRNRPVIGDQPNSRIH